MRNIAFKQGGNGLQIVLYELDSEFNLVLGFGRDTKFAYMVISPEEVKILIGRGKAYTQQHLENDYKFTLTSVSWPCLVLAVVPKAPSHLAFLSFCFQIFINGHYSPYLMQSF